MQGRSSEHRSFWLGPFRSDERMDALLRREALSSPLVRMLAGLVVPQLRFLLSFWLAGVRVAALAASVLALAAAFALGWRALARPFNTLA